MDIIRSSVPSPFAVPVIKTPKKPTASDLNEYLQLYVQRPIVPEPVRASFNAGLGSLLLERQPNYLAKPVIGPTASIFPLRTGGPQAPFRSRLGALPSGVDLSKLAFDDAALSKYASIMAEEEMLKANSLRASAKLAPFDFKAALAAAAVPAAPSPNLYIMKATSPTAPVIPPDQALLISKANFFRETFFASPESPRSARYVDMAKRFGAKVTPDLMKAIQSDDLKTVAAKIQEAALSFLYSVAVFTNGGELPAGIDKSRFASDMNASAIDTMAYVLFSDSMLRLVEKNITVGFVDDVKRQLNIILNSYPLATVADFVKADPMRAYYELFVAAPVKAVQAFNAEQVAKYIAYGSVAGAFFLADVAKQYFGYVPYGQYSQEADLAKAKLATAQTEYDALKASLELKIAELGAADTQLSDVRAQLADKIAELASVIADREQNYLAKASLEAAGYVSKADLTKAQGDLQSAVNQYNTAAAALEAATADHTKVKADFDAYKRLVANDYMLKSACKVQSGATFGQRLKALFSRK